MVRGKMRPNTPTIILIGGPFTADTGEQLDSRQPFAEDPLCFIAQKALAASELWWHTTTSLVWALVTAEGDEGFANVSGPRSVIALKPDGTPTRRRLAPLLTGGVRKKPDDQGRWRMSDSEVWGELDSRILVDAYGMFWRMALSMHDYAYFERTWFKHDKLIIVAPHTYAETVYLNGYVEWVARGRPLYAPGPPLPYPEDGRPSLPTVVTTEADFRVTGAVQDGAWVDTSALEAARALLQIRFDLKLGIWDLVTNETLRTTLLKETPVAVPPEAPAPQTAGVVQHLKAWEAGRTEEQKRRDAHRDEVVEALTETFDTAGWTSSLPGVGLSVNPTSRYKRCFPLAYAPDCDEAEANARHPSLQPGTVILWLRVEIHPDDGGAGSVDLVIPPPLGSLIEDVFFPIYMKLVPKLEGIASPHRMRVGHGCDMREVVTFGLAQVATSNKFEIADWRQRLHEIAEKTPAWANALAPIAQYFRDAVTKNPLLGCR